MKIQLNDIPYLLKNDYYFRKKIKRLTALGCLSILTICILFYFAGSLLMSGLLKTLTLEFPVVSEWMFKYARGLISGFFLEDLLQTFAPLTDNTNVAELKKIISTYFEQLKNNDQIDFQGFQKFISTAKNIISDGNVLPGELDMIRKLLPN